jgi:hypothetical protein
MSDSTVIDGIDYGPLAVLVGTWKGDKGMDVAPEPDSDEHNPYYETIEFSAAGDVTNAEKQTLAIVSYHQVVSRKSNDEVFHDQMGYWLWDKADNTIVETFVIPRGVAVVAGGNTAPPASSGEEVVLDVAAKAGADDCGIVQAPFMFKQAKTTAFKHEIKVKGDQMSYSETTFLDIYGKTSYEHTDENTLHRVS